KSGPETAQSRTTAIASTNVDERPTCPSTQRANRAKSGVALVSTSKVDSEDPSGINQPSIFQCPLPTSMHRILFQLGGIFPGLQHLGAARDKRPRRPLASVRRRPAARRFPQPGTLDIGEPLACRHSENLGATIR